MASTSWPPPGSRRRRGERRGVRRRALPRAPGRHPGRARRPLPRDAELQDEELRAPRSRGPDRHHRQWPPLAGARALPARIPARHAAARARGTNGGDPRALRPYPRAVRASRARRARLHEDGDARRLARGLQEQAERRRPQSLGGLRARPRRRARSPPWRPGLLLRDRGIEAGDRGGGGAPRREWDPAHPDENVAYYQAKLEELYAKFAPVCGVEAAAGQGELGL